MNISIIIPNYNGEELLKKNLPKVFEAAEYFVEKDGGDVELIIVDDCSTDGSMAQVQILKRKAQSYSVKLKTIQNEKNLGFSSTVNRGVKEATGEIAVFLNTDVAPEKNFLPPLIKHFADPLVFAVGCMDKSIDLPAGKAGNGKVVLRGRGVGKWTRGFLMHARGEVDRNNTLWVGGGSGAFRKLLWEKLGGFNELYNPFYYEDIDLSYRALKSGFKIFFEPDSIVTHEHEKGSIKRFYSLFKIRTVAYRNQFIFVWLNATDFDLQIMHVLWLPYNFLKAILRVDLAFFLGFLQALIYLPKAILGSFKAQKLFVRSDREVMKNLSV